MYSAIPRSSGIFSPEVADEINNSLSKTNDMIENFHPSSLEHKYSLSDLKINSIHSSIKLQNNSFAIEHEKWIQLIIESSEDIDCNDLEIAEMGLAVDYPITFHLMTSTDISTKILGQINKTKIKIIKGKLEKGTRYLAAFFFITSNS